MKLPRELRTTDPRWKVPAKTYAQKAVRDAQFSANAAAKGQCNVAYWGMQEADGNIRIAKRLRVRGSKTAARTVANAHRYIGTMCDRLGNPLPRSPQKKVRS